jgi:hypothetical protein
MFACLHGRSDSNREAAKRACRYQDGRKPVRIRVIMGQEPVTTQTLSVRIRTIPTSDAEMVNDVRGWFWRILRTWVKILATRKVLFGGGTFFAFQSAGAWWSS